MQSEARLGRGVCNLIYIRKVTLHYYYYYYYYRSMGLVEFLAPHHGEKKLLCGSCCLPERHDDTPAHTTIFFLFGGTAKSLGLSGYVHTCVWPHTLTGPYNNILFEEPGLLGSPHTTHPDPPPTTNIVQNTTIKALSVHMLLWKSKCVFFPLAAHFLWAEGGFKTNRGFNH